MIPAYDKSIDIEIDAGKTLYKNFGIELEYANAHEFLRVAMFADHNSNLCTLAEHARENAIICRSYINTEAFGEIIELHTMLQNAAKSYTEIDYKLIDDALSLISEIWGEISKLSKSNASDHFLKLGRLIERLDFHLRFSGENEHTTNITEQINATLAALALHEEDATLKQTQKSAQTNIIQSMHAQVEALIVH
jgi:uncharacterized alpha-E superfamily protein